MAVLYKEGDRTNLAHWLARSAALLPVAFRMAANSSCKQFLQWISRKDLNSICKCLRMARAGDAPTGTFPQSVRNGAVAMRSECGRPCMSQRVMSNAGSTEAR